MRVVRADQETGVTVPSPFERTIKILMAPDKEDVPDIMLSHATILERARGNG